MEILKKTCISLPKSLFVEAQLKPKITITDSSKRQGCKTLKKLVAWALVLPNMRMQSLFIPTFRNQESKNPQLKHFKWLCGEFFIF